MYKVFDTTALNPNIKLPIVIRFAGCETCAPCFDYGPYRRDHYIIHFVVKGKGVFQTEGKTYTIEAGEGFLIHPYEITYYRADKDDPWEYYWIAWSGEYADNILNDMVFIKDQSVIQCKNTNEIIKCFKNIFNTYENNYNVYGLLGGFYSLLSSFAGNIVRKNQILTKAVSYIHNNYSTIKSVFEIADYVFLSRSQLYRIFMNQLSRSPQEYLIDYRISRAQDLLEAGVLSVEDISKRCGFNNATHFSNTFKKKTGLSPLKYQSVREGGLGFFYAPVK